MSRAAKLRAKSDVGLDPRMGRVVNDNKPVAFPGHELSDLDGALQEPAAEAVLHYGRLSQIASFPLHPHAAAMAMREPPAMDALPERVRRRLPVGKKRTTITCLSSFLFHAALFAALTTASVTLPEDPVEDAGDTVSVVMLGNSDADQLSAGEKQEQPDPAPEQVVAEAVQADSVQPTTDTAEVTPTETPTEVTPTEVQPAETASQAVQPVQPTTAEPQPDPVQPMQQVQAVSSETIISPEPEVMTSAVPAQPTVAQPTATAVQPEEMKPAEAQTTEAQPTEVQPTPVQPAPVQPAEQPVETVQAFSPPPEEVVMPLAKPEPPKPVAKPKEVPKKQPPKKVKPKSGSQGDSQQDAKRGSSEGTETAQSDHSSESAGNRQGSGSAAVANYPGKVQSRIRRSVRVPDEFRRMTAATTVRVRLTIGSSGDLTAVSLSRSSGVSELDNAVVEGVRRAAPFPPLPPEWGKPSWSFTQEVQVTGN